METYLPSTLDDIAKINSLFHQNLVRISDNCKQLIKALNNYAWDSNASMKGIDKPLADKYGYADLCDSIRAPIIKSFTKDDPVLIF